MTQDPNPDYPPPTSYPEFPEERPAPPPPAEQRIRVETPSGRPWVTYTLLVITVLIYVLQAASTRIYGDDVVALMGIKVNDLILVGQYWRLITPMFLHGSELHLLFNMYALYIFGTGLERYYGHGRFTLLYFLGGFAGNVFSFIFTASPSLGSSTAIFGLLAAEGVFIYQNQKMLGNMARRALINIIVIAGINLLIGLSPGIDNWGHMGGLLGGAIFAFLGGPILQLQGIAPNLRFIDSRETGDVVRAALIDAVIFGALAVGTIYLRTF